MDDLDNRTIVRVLYQALLSREADAEGLSHYVSALDNRTKTLHEVTSELVTEFASEEGKAAHPYQSWERKAVVFVHLGKTGGTTLHDLLSKCFPESRICPDRGNVLHLRPLVYLAKYDFFSGHFDYFSLHCIPRRTVRTVSIFREPFARLISWYRFCRSHPANGEFAENITFRLAKQLDPTHFFAHPLIRSRADANNTYLCYFGSAVDRALQSLGPDERSLSDPDSVATIDVTQAADSVQSELVRAIHRVLDLDAIGLTERFDESVQLIFSALDFPNPGPITPQNVTDLLSDLDTSFSPVPPIDLTPELARVLSPLTKYDRVIYAAARSEFNRRLAKSRGNTCPNSEN
jgi:hypothetical protein